MDTSSIHHEVIFSSPGMGHLRPVLQLAQLLSTRQNYKITIFLPTATNDTHHLNPLSSTNHHGSVEVIQIPAPDISTQVEPDAKVVHNLGVLMREIRPAFRSALLALKPNPTVLIFQMFTTESIILAQEFKLPKYVYVTTGAWFLALTTYLPLLDKEIKGEYVDQTQPLKIPGCESVRPDDLPDPMLERSDPQYDEYKRMGNEIPLFDGVLVNTWEDLERKTLAAFSEDEVMREVMKIPVYPIGPLITETAKTADRSIEAVEWLGRQPAESVVYISFGSAGVLSAKQLIELAWGLELSQQRFVWVVRPHNNESAATDTSYLSATGNINYSSNTNNTDMNKYLPEGFMERTREIGFIVPYWAPQLEILSHPSIGGFLTHCGWNSTLESIVNGVPMITWPLHAEQRMNATMLVEQLGVAIRPKEMPWKKIIGREEIERMLRTLLVDEQGRVLRKKVKELQSSGKMAFGDGGSSFNSLSQFFGTIEKTSTVNQIDSRMHDIKLGGVEDGGQGPKD